MTAMAIEPFPARITNCPANGCDSAIPIDKIACDTDWFNVSDATKNQVAQAWSNPDPLIYAGARRKAIWEMNNARARAKVPEVRND